ncbi:MAG: prepilin-type N-terminal cleavage/methylation domain-containing protein [Rhizobacter sp.]
MLKRSLHRGFTLVEVMVVVTIIAIFMLFALPGMNAYLTSSRIRNAAQTFEAGLMKARSEAIRTNAAVEFVTTAASPPVGSSAFNATGTNWVIRRFTGAPAVDGDLVDSRSSLEGSTAQVTQSSTVGSFAGAAATAPITFDALGRAGGQTLFNFSHPSTNNCGTGAAVRCAGVVVSPGGRIHLCVNHPDILATDPRFCG